MPNFYLKFSSDQRLSFVITQGRYFSDILYYYYTVIIKKSVICDSALLDI